MPEQTLSETMDRRLRISNPSDNVFSQPQYTTQPAMAASALQTPTTSQVKGKESSDLLSSSKTTNEEKDSKKDDNDGNDNDDDDDSDLDEFDDDDEALEAFRQRRLAEMKQTHQAAETNKGKGHGEVRTITQDEFLPECTGSKYVVVHFFHDDFERCKIMDHHLNIIAPLHLSCKFVRINADKAPFFVAKLAIQTLPTTLVFKDGKTIDRLTGFDGLSGTKNPDQFPTSRVGLWLEKTGAIEYEGPESDEENDGSRKNKSGIQSKWLSVYDEDV